MFMNTETVTIHQKGEDFEIVVQHDQTGIAYSITISHNAYCQLRQQLVRGLLPSKDKVVGKGFNNANGSEYNRRNVLKDADDDLYYTGWMDCFDWLIGNDRQLINIPHKFPKYKI